MCLSVPAKILKVKDKKAIVDSFGKNIEVGLDLVKNIKKGDYGLISNGFLIKKISVNEAKEILNILNL